MTTDSNFNGSFQQIIGSTTTDINYNFIVTTDNSYHTTTMSGTIDPGIFISGPINWNGSDNYFYPNGTGSGDGKILTFNGLSFLADGVRYNFYYNSDTSQYEIASDISTQPGILTINESCVLKGTKILTTEGEILVENLTENHIIISGENKDMQFKIRRIIHSIFMTNPYKVIFEGKILYVTIGHTIFLKSVLGNRMGGSPTNFGYEKITDEELNNLVNMTEQIYYNVELETNISRRIATFWANGIEIESYSEDKL